MRAMENPVYLKHCEIARQISAEAKDPNSPYHGKCVGLANGRVVAVADNMDSVIDEVNRVEPNRLNTFVLDTNWDDEEVIEIWGIS